MGGILSSRVPKPPKIEVQKKRASPHAQLVGATRIANHSRIWGSKQRTDAWGCILTTLMRPIIGITADRCDGRFRVGENYANCVVQAGGVPMILPPIIGEEERFIDICDGFIFSGGDDPVMEQWGIETHLATTRCDTQRQKFETTLLGQLSQLPDTPVFGICLGMQWMGLLAGGTLVQDLELKFAEHHKNGTHLVSGELGSGVVHTSHHQAITETGSLTIASLADDGIIEAVCDHDRKWYVGVQWHPERTENEELGQGLFNSFCKAATS